MTYIFNPATDLLRHYDVTGKVCPKFYVHHPAHFTKLKVDVPLPEQVVLELNGTLADTHAYIYKGNYYIKLHDLECNMLQVTYDTTRNIPILTVLSP